MYPVPKNYPVRGEPKAHPRHRKRKIVFRPKARVFLLLAVVGYVLFSFGRLEWKERQIEKEFLFYQSQKQALEAQARELEAEIQAMNSRAFVERIARQELGLIYPGEKVLMRAEPGDVLPLEPSDPKADIRD
ncbi:hypothetical protein SY88_11120 [Clostridiales bacterium PH28_bin88]|nr:hypothetical protein SY88_11120 [Clostridiales bacterium PH28_bin88]